MVGKNTSQNEQESGRAQCAPARTVCAAAHSVSQIPNLLKVHQMQHKMVKVADLIKCKTLEIERNDKCHN